MKAFITGLILIAVSGAALIWHLVTRSAPSGGASQGPERTTLCMVWKAQRGHGTVWLCGSQHLLRPEDYPLPPPYEQAFTEAKVLVTETPHDAAGDSARREQVVAIGQLPPGEKIEQRLSAAAWAQLKDACATADVNLSMVQNMKPWQATQMVMLGYMRQFGYQPALGMETQFASRAGNRPLAALETVEVQLAAFDSLDAATQEAMVLRAVDEDMKSKQRAQDISDAWHEGDCRRLLTLDNGALDSLPALKKALLDDRHAAWLPQLEKYLDGDETVMVLVGARHLCGRGSLVELLEAKGAKLTQMEYRTKRPKP